MKIVVLDTDEYCDRLVLDIAATNANARRFAKREGQVDNVIGSAKPSGSFA
ncbi:hypothetical protein RFN29_24560 [Mesorhizobium sp. VK22B]|uniref:Uncharacterized protein n=1 Tax=Mesorhizobium captivum TaxID=3072319 RepID=A0ABU4Z6B3_9HYPH|nr:hypothetical protein [Mesorhizobium sp. VK22B]MDX8494746.1 hypothetical protein [Mesorhizobium sp. VK22B]